MLVQTLLKQYIATSAVKGSGEAGRPMKMSLLLELKVMILKGVLSNQVGT